MAVEVISSSNVPVPVWAGIAYTPICQVQGWIVRASHPHRTASCLPRVTLPSLVPGLSRSWDGVKAPDFPPSVGIVSTNKASDAILAAGGADGHHVLQFQKGIRYCINRICYCPPRVSHMSSVS